MIRALKGPKVILNLPRRSLKMSEAVDKQRKALGKGLAALLPGKASGATTRGTAVATATISAPPPTMLPVESIYPNPMQPRAVFQHDRLEELAASIRANGIIQPLIVR